MCVLSSMLVTKKASFMSPLLCLTKNTLKLHPFWNTLNLCVCSHDSLLQKLLEKLNIYEIFQIHNVLSLGFCNLGSGNPDAFVIHGYSQLEICWVHIEWLLSKAKPKDKTHKNYKDHMKVLRKWWNYLTIWPYKLFLNSSLRHPWYKNKFNDQSMWTSVWKKKWWNTPNHVLMTVVLRERLFPTFINNGSNLFHF